ncbi:MAG: succinate dehydrogenase cytochrome b subunit [Acidobacteria bacterium]|nr:succinate dehydrogenase cytochrome b subunit [Acidobacteriota bacterium]MCL5288456.1 succinate dehydrogenase cytochrome b subunit [Acidobacteriota bacterium]
MSSSAPAVAAVQSPAAESRLARILGSSIGQKLVMAVTGVILSGFIVGHMVGNLTVFKGAEAINAYGVALRKFPALLWAVRFGLLLSVGLHIWAYLALSFKSWGARPQGYKVAAYKEASFASRTMRWTGPILGAFVIFHILHFTTGTITPGFAFKEGDVFHNLVAGLSYAPVAAFYIVAMACLALHVFHGVWSLFQSLGISQPRYESTARRVATLFTIAVVGGFVIIPIAVLAGILKLQ